MSSRYQLKTVHESFLYGPLQCAYKWKALDLFHRVLLSGPCLLDKTVQKSGKVFVSYTRAVIAHLNEQFVFYVVESNFSQTILMAVLNGVIDEVRQHVMNVLSVGKDLTLKACIIFNDKLNIFC